MYGVVTRDGCHIDVSNSERGAKQYATRNGYDTVSKRPNMGYNITVLAKKVNNKWIAE